MNGFINILKPVGATASDVVVCVRHIFREKAGHLGTLDPGAAGVLPVALGKATKLFDFLTDKVKRYRAFFTFGKTTDTLDSYGVQTDSGKIPTEAEMNSVLPQFVGEIYQIPPMYSAISVNGVRSYKLARSGAEVELNPRKVNVYEFTLLRRQSADTFVFDIKCGAGTYIRSLARDLAGACGSVAYMSALIRLQSGCFEIENAFTLDEVREQKENCLMDIMYPLKDIDVCVLPDSLYEKLSDGQKLQCPFADGYRKIYCRERFFGLARNSDGILDLRYCMKDW